MSIFKNLKGHPGLTIAGENTSGCYAENSGDCVRNQFDYGIKIATGHCFVKEGRSCERTGFAVDFETKGQDALKVVTENQSEINAAAQQRLDAYIPPQTANDRNNRLAFNDMMFIRELNKGNVKKEDLKNLYRMLYPGKEKKFDAMIASKPSKKSFNQKSRKVFFRSIFGNKTNKKSQTLIALRLRRFDISQNRRYGGGGYAGNARRGAQRFGADFV